MSTVQWQLDWPGSLFAPPTGSEWDLTGVNVQVICIVSVTHCPTPDQLVSLFILFETYFGISSFMFEHFPFQGLSAPSCSHCLYMYIVSWEPEGRYHYSKMFHWEPEGRFHYSKRFRWEPDGRYCCTKSMAIAPLWFSTEHLWMLIVPFWLSTDDI